MARPILLVKIPFRYKSLKNERYEEFKKRTREVAYDYCVLFNWTDEVKDIVYEVLNPVEVKPEELGKIKEKIKKFKLF